MNGLPWLASLLDAAGVDPANATCHHHRRTGAYPHDWLTVTFEPPLTGTAVVALMGQLCPVPTT